MPTTTVSIESIQARTKAFADARRVLSERVSALTSELEAAKRRKLPGIQSALAAAKDAEAALQSELEAAPELFERPRTIVVHGIKVGWGKCKGKIEWADPQTVVSRIKEHFPKLVHVLVKTTQRPVRKALAQLSVADLKRIGCSATSAGDGVVIKPTDGDVEKLVDQLLKADRSHEDEEE